MYFINSCKCYICKDFNGIQEYLNIIVVFPARPQQYKWKALNSKYLRAFLFLLTETILKHFIDSL